MKPGPRRTPWPRRFWAKVDDNGPVPDHRPELGACWIWTGCLDQGGYGRFVKNFSDRHTPDRAHRLAYEQMIGPIPADLDLDHLCRVRRCVNPDHLEPVPRWLNLRRGAGIGGVLS